MANKITFWFDFSSPYAYLLGEQIDKVAIKYQREVEWIPILLGVVFKTLNTVSLINQPGQSNYAPNDLARSARFYGVEYQHPSIFPVSTVHAARAFYALSEGSDQSLAKKFAHQIWRMYFIDNQDISNRELVTELAEDFTNDESIANKINDPTIKEMLINNTDNAIKRGIFGAPWVEIDGEQFWGADRLAQIEMWLKNDGF